jgi:hypothetical protein
MNCLHCNKPIEGKRNTKKYCNNTCKQYAYLNRNFAIPTNLSAASIVNHEVKRDQDGKSEEFSDSNNETNNHGNITFLNNNQLLTKPINYEYRNQIKEEEYKYIFADILERVQNSFISLNTGQYYFTRNANGGRMTDVNFAAFSYFVPRLRCIIENLFSLTYKRKVYYKTINAISMALLEMLKSDHIKMLPNDFPFIDDFIKLFDQFQSFAKALEDDKKGVKFSLNKAAIVRYIIILYLIRDCTKRESFSKLFPEVYKPSTHTKANTGGV